MEKSIWFAKVKNKDMKMKTYKKCMSDFFKHLLRLALLSYENKYGSLLENKGEVYRIWRIDICWILHVGFIKPWYTFLHYLESWVTQGKRLSKCRYSRRLHFIHRETWILKLWYQKHLMKRCHTKKRRGKLYIMRQVKVIKLRLKITNCGENVKWRSKRCTKCGTIMLLSLFQ